MNNSQKNFIKEILSFILDKEFLSKLYLTFFMLIFYRLITFVPLPGLNLDLVTDELIASKFSGSLLGFIDRFSGGSLQRLSVMALGISPYIMCSLFFYFGHHVFPYLRELKKEGALGRQKISTLTKLSSFVLSFFQGMGLAHYLQLQNLSYFSGYFFIFQSGILIATSTMIVIWIADQISVRGIGKGSSLIIYVNIVAGIPVFAKYLWMAFKHNEFHFVKLGVFLIMTILLLFLVTFCERIYKTIKAQNLIMNKSIMHNMPDHLVYMKLNPAGIYPSMFASTWMTLPFWLDNLFRFSQYEFGAWILSALTPGCYLYITLHAILIFLTSYIYAELAFNPEETAKRFRNDTVIAGQLPGKSTQEFLEEKLFYVATLGGIYLICVCCIPELFISKTSQGLYINGTSYIIVVGVAIDLIDKVSAGVAAKLIDKSMKSLKKGYFKV